MLLVNAKHISMTYSYFLSEGPNLAVRPIDKIVFSIMKSVLHLPFRGKGLFMKLLNRYYKTVVVKPKNEDLKIHFGAFSESHRLIYNEVFEEKVYDLDKVGFQPDLIIDCGAHIGLFTLLASRYFPKTTSYAFEPNAENLFYLERNCQQNALPVHVIPAAVSNYDGTAWFSSTVSHGGSIKKAKSTDTLAVSVKNLIDFIKEKKMSSLLLKVDIEGEEQVVFPELVDHLPDQCAIFFETHAGAKGFETISELLTNKGFKVDLTRSHDIYCDGFAKRG